MKSLFRIIIRYVFSAVLVVLLILIGNVLFFGNFMIRFQNNNDSMQKIALVAEELSQNDSGIHLSDQGQEMLKQYAFGMILDDEGNVIWSYELPEALNKKYTVGDVASFSKWYLEDYPVFSWNTDEGLLVLGMEKGSYWKSGVLVRMDALERMIDYIPLFFIINIGMVILLCVLFGWRLYSSFKPVIHGVEELADYKTVHLKEHGVAKELAGKVNQTSAILDKQKKIIEKRDKARTEWVAGVSHDIRTPLSIILGYSEKLSEADNLRAEQKKQLQVMEEQGIKIKTMVEDLNLTSKLEYHMQPLRKESYRPAELLRRIITAYYNQGLEEKYELDLRIEEDVEAVTLSGDVKLLSRVADNLIGNSIRHNQEGCRIAVAAELVEEEERQALLMTFSDSGKGIPRQVIEILEQEKNMDTEENCHVMGLRIAKQIVEAHDGSFEIAEETVGSKICIKLPYLRKKIL